MRTQPVRVWPMVVGVGGVTAMALLYAGVARPRLHDWGATTAERDAPLPGDDVVPNPRYATTRAVTINAPAARVWPWLVQIGYQRGGLYSYDWLDRLGGFLDRPSADRILPEFQHLAAGDVIPLGNGPDWPVHSVIPERALVLAPEAPSMRVSWTFALHQSGDGTTRLISRVRGAWEPKLATELASRALLEPAAFLMERKMLLGIKERVERSAADPGHADASPVGSGMPLSRGIGNRQIDEEN